VDTTRIAKDEVRISLSYDEALVLSDLLHRWLPNGDQQARQFDPTEKRVLDDLNASFEPVIDEAFAADYAEVVAAARLRLVALD
jgi:hypothetical protein